ncbi:hypothetical protein AB98_3182 [Escherichia coli 1-176-05_S3_C1]|nr:hypothetical protein AB98_3182 [Escherichia coli 1-176-05_S3_C1]
MTFCGGLLNVNLNTNFKRWFFLSLFPLLIAEIATQKESF